jgi:hypothetical protein
MLKGVQKEKQPMPTKPTTKTKPPARSAAPKPDDRIILTAADLHPEPRETERQKRLRVYGVEARELPRNNNERLQRLDEMTFDGTCVLALADLFLYGSHSAASMDDTSNWLGRFFSEVLLEVAVNGPEWANAHPEFVKLEFEKAIEELRGALSFCREIESKMPPAVLEEIEKWPAETKTSTAGA